MQGKQIIAIAYTKAITEVFLELRGLAKRIGEFKIPTENPMIFSRPIWCGDLSNDLRATSDRMETALLAFASILEMDVDEFGKRFGDLWDTTSNAIESARQKLPGSDSEWVKAPCPTPDTSDASTGLETAPLSADASAINTDSGSW